MAGEARPGVILTAEPGTVQWRRFAWRPGNTTTYHQNTYATGGAEVAESRRQQGARLAIAGPSVPPAGESVRHFQRRRAMGRLVADRGERIDPGGHGARTDARGTARSPYIGSPHARPEKTPRFYDYRPQDRNLAEEWFSGEHFSRATMPSYDGQLAPRNRIARRTRNTWRAIPDATNDYDEPERYYHADGVVMSGGGLRARFKAGGVPYG